jgi:hypothetical protein
MSTISRLENPHPFRLDDDGALPAQERALERPTVGWARAGQLAEQDRFVAAPVTANAMVFQGFSPADDATRTHLQQLSEGAPSFDELDPSASDAEVNAKMEALEKDLGNRVNGYGLALAFAQGPNANPHLVKAYQDLFAAMFLDAKDIEGWRGKSREDKIALFNRMSPEIAVEVRHNVNLTAGDGGRTSWTRDDILSLDEALLNLPSRFVLENRQLGEIQMIGPARDPVSGRPIGGDANDSSGVIRLVTRLDAMGNRIPGVDLATVIHEVGHFLDDENPRWQEFKNISGWRDVDTSRASDILAGLSDGDWALGSELGFADAPNERFIVQKNGDQVFAYKESQKDSFVRGYGTSTPFEDFATCFEEFVTDPENLRKKNPDKFEFMRKFFEG